MSLKTRIKGHDCELHDYYKAQLRRMTFWQRLKLTFNSCILVSQWNSRSRWYLRSIDDYEAEMERHYNSKHFYIVHPFSIFRACWQVFMCIVYMVSLFLIPFDNAFDEIGRHSKDQVVLRSKFMIILFVLDIVCIFDVVMNFFTGYLHHASREIVLDRQRIARHYTHGYFFIDLVSSLPLEYAILYFYNGLDPNVELAESNMSTITVFGLMSFIKVYRAKTFISHARQICEMFDLRPATSRCVRLIFIFLIFIHWTACINYLIPFVVNGSELSNPEYSYKYNLSWVVQDGLIGESTWTKYRSSLLRATTDIARISLDPPEYAAMAFEDMIVTIVSVVASVIYNVYLFVVILRIVMSKHHSEVKYHEIMNQLEAFMRHKQLPLPIQARLQAFYMHRFPRKYFKENAIMAGMSESLRNDIRLFCCRRLVHSVAIFQDLPNSVIAQIVSCLHPEVCLANDLIIRAGTTGDCMYFLASGTVAVLMQTGKEICHLVDGAHFGEVCLIIEDQLRIATVLALEICDLYRLDRQDFQKCIADYPQLHAAIERLARDRAAHAYEVDRAFRQQLINESLRKA